MRPEEVTSPPEAIRLRRYGSSGPQVAVLHGGPGAPGSARTLAEGFASRGLQALEPLQRRSGRLPLSVDQHVKDLRAVLPSPVRLVGWSWGAMLALSYASRFPSAVDRLLLVGCGTYDVDARSSYQRTMRQRLGEEGAAWVDRWERELDAEQDPQKRGELFARLIPRYTGAQAYDEAPEERPEEAVDAQGMRETWEDVERLQAEGVEPAAFRAITCPVLLLHGEEDPHPGAMIARSLRPFLPQLSFLPLPRCGHRPWLERQAADPFWTHAVRFLLA